jgi:hypothetical protein
VIRIRFFDGKNIVQVVKDICPTEHYGIPEGGIAHKVAKASNGSMLYTSSPFSQEFTTGVMQANKAPSEIIRFKSLHMHIQEKVSLLKVGEVGEVGEWLEGIGGKSINGAYYVEEE